MEEESGIHIGQFFFESTYSVRVKDDFIKKEPGVYVILSEFPDEFIPYIVLDAGESEDVADAIRYHERKECWQNYGSNNPLSVAVLYEPDPIKRKNIVLEVIKKFKPPCADLTVFSESETCAEEEIPDDMYQIRFLKNTLTNGEYESE